MQIRKTPVTFTASGVLEMYRRVRLNNDFELEYAGASDLDAIGVTLRRAAAQGDLVPVQLFLGGQTIPMVASAAIAKNVGTYAAADGKTADSGSVLCGLSLTEAGAAGDYLEVLPSATTPTGTWARSTLTEDALQPYPIKIADLRVWDAPTTNAVATTAANDDLAVVYNTFGTASPSVESGDGKATTITRKVGFQFTVPPEYVSAGDLKVRLNAGMKTTVSDGTATIDVQAYRAAAPTVDICATSATSINSLTAANKDFTLTATDVVPGDLIDIVVTIAVTDSATVTAVIGKVNLITLLADIKG